MRRGRRNALVSLLILFVVYYYYFASPPPSARRPPPSTLESIWLERVMNARADTSSLRSNCSFDWSKVVFEYAPPAKLRRLPSGRPVALPQVQHSFPPESRSAAATREARRTQVRTLFVKNWRSYRKYAWKKDALLPITAGYSDQFN